ncbi:hypothetical protein AB4Z48_18700 [Cupriavidus sp. 2TAF22]|uniref:hypothetical protein n=1 Tax=unclassified Cupriavidus TaxID=2640874 RepID=UPI003F9205B6
MNDAEAALSRGTLLGDATNVGSEPARRKSAPSSRMPRFRHSRADRIELGEGAAVVAQIHGVLCARQQLARATL